MQIPLVKYHFVRNARKF